MSEQIQRIGSYLGHLVKARTRHGVHSPFVYDLIEKVLRPQTSLSEHEPIEALRDDLLRSEQTIRVNDLGAGSHVFDLPVRRVADIARNSLKPQRQAELLFRLCRYFRASTVLELGTSFGISTLYLAQGAEDGQVLTIEGCPQTFRIAQHHFEQMRQRNVVPILGSFQRRLPELLQHIEALDIIFIDGHHAKDATVAYFNMCMGKAHNDTVFILDDIHWSRGMEEAWSEVKSDPRVSVTIDLYNMGLAFLRGEQAKEHFTLRY
ncbi:MAG TPA: class I SAM-dependent methyltransferase [Flavobacteriales bacterium]|nr:class I SAM-dependent methyltransferase [Flavobacteriales bacterium]